MELKKLILFIEICKIVQIKFVLQEIISIPTVSILDYFYMINNIK